MDYYHLDKKDLLEIINLDDNIKNSQAPAIINACERIKQAQINNQRILVVGDYDADGITSTAILMRLFSHLGIQANFYIPKRETEGYGLNIKLVELAYDHHFDLLVTVDNGVKALEAIARAKELNVEMMIIDHHEYEDLPEVASFVHSKIIEDDFQHFSAAGLALLMANYFYNDDYNIVLAAIGLTGDLMSIDHHIRKIVRKANKLIKINDYPTIKHLLTKGFNDDSIAFEIVPKLNALSRTGLGNVNNLVKYLNSDNDDEILRLATDIDSINNYRKKITSEYFTKIMNENIDDQAIIVFESEDFKEGLCGLIASLLVKEYRRPAIIFARSGEVLKGSGRSFKEFDLYQYLKGLKIFESFGGHAKAIGLSIKPENISRLKRYIADNPVPITVSTDEYIDIDADDLTVELVEFIDKLRPFGKDFEEPIFRINNLEIKSRFMIKNRYPKWTLKNGIEAISFEKIHQIDHITAFIGQLKFNNFKTQKKISVTVKNIL